MVIFALGMMCVCAVLSHVQLFATLWTVARQAPLSMEFSRQESWSGLLFPTPGDLPDPGMELESLGSLALASGLFTTAPPGKLGHDVKLCQWRGWRDNVGGRIFPSGFWCAVSPGFCS